MLEYTRARLVNILKVYDKDDTPPRINVALVETIRDLDALEKAAVKWYMENK